MRGFILGTIATAVAFAIVTRLVPQYLNYDGSITGLIVLAVIFGVVNGLIGPIVRLLALPVRVVTFGLIGFVINAGLLLLTAWAADFVGLNFTVGDFPPTFNLDTIIAAIIGAAVLGLVSTIVHVFVPD
ncbi:MAG: phage holin family protein [Chloroflexota bacterium]